MRAPGLAGVARARQPVRGSDVPSELLGGSVTILDVLALHPLLALLGGQHPDGTPQIALWPLVLLALLAYGLVWWGDRQGLTGAAATLVHALGAGTGIAGLIWVELGLPYVLGDRGDLGTFLHDVTRSGGSGLGVGALFLAGAYIWRQAIAGKIPDLSKIYTRFARILFVFLAYVVVGVFPATGFVTPVLTRDLFLIFVVGLWAMALARSRLEGTRSHQLLSIRWFVFSSSLIGGVLALGLLAGGLFGPDIMAALFAPLATVVQVLGLVLVSVFEAIALVVFAILDFVFGGFRVQPPPGTPAPSLTGGLRKLALDIQQQPGSGGRPDATLLGLLGLAVVLIVVALVARAVLRNADRDRRALSGGDRESLLDWGTLLQSLKPARRPDGAVPDPLQALLGNPAYRYTVRVRKAYRKALTLAAARGVRRLPSQTAGEVLPALQSVLPEAGPPLGQLTALYDSIRYTTAPATAAEAEAAEQAVQGLTPAR
ncbi:MAG TPA: DUF4129 domain-containing protein [Chloroflexia bacterium]|nr:DUF4129 domain-containing protein [Chloroflexia bacterium]